MLNNARWKSHDSPHKRFTPEGGKSELKFHSDSTDWEDRERDKTEERRE
jgi:hypothetical protein